jgi:hypothetical protein
LISVRRRAPRRSLRATIFDGDRRVWHWSAAVGLPLIALILIWCLVPRAYYTGTDSVNALTVSAPVTAGTSACVERLNIPAGTARIQFSTVSGQATAPELQLSLRTARESYVSPVTAASAAIGVINRISFPIPRLTIDSVSVPAELCVRAVAGAFGIGGTPATEALQPPLRIGGRATLLRVAVWYLPRAGATRSYLDELRTMFDRAALFAPGFVRPCLFALIFLLVLPATGLLAVRCLAVGAAGGSRKLALGLYVVAVLNGAAWSLITPPFQSPDEVDHFAYVQSLAERGEKPSPYPASSDKRWSTAEEDSLLGTDMLTDHLMSDSRAPELIADASAYRQLISRDHPARDDGGGLQTTSGYGPLYYLALTPGYLLASSGSVFSQLEAARLMSVLIGALSCVFAYLTVREIAERPVWLAVLTGLLVAFQPMYSFLSGTLNSDIGIDAGAAAVAYLLIRMIRHGLDRRLTGVLGLLLGALPFVKDSAYELYPLALVAVGGALWRHRSFAAGARVKTIASLAVLAGSLAFSYVLASVVDSRLTPAAPFPGATTSVTTTSGSLSVPLHHPFSYLAYLWEVFLPRLPGMTPHFPPGGLPSTTIFTRRGWAAFGWYDVFFPGWVYQVLAAAMLGGLVLGLLAMWRERRFVGARRVEAVILILFPIVTVASFEAVFYTVGTRTAIAEMGRYVFPALIPLAALAVGALYALGRQRVLAAGTILLTVVLAFCYASQLLTFTAFYS